MTRFVFPGGGTALLDAVGQTIKGIGIRLDKTPEPDRPGDCFLVGYGVHRIYSMRRARSGR